MKTYLNIIHGNLNFFFFLKSSIFLPRGNFLRNIQMIQPQKNLIGSLSCWLSKEKRSYLNTLEKNDENS